MTTASTSCLMTSRRHTRVEQPHALEACSDHLLNCRGFHVVRRQRLILGISSGLSRRVALEIGAHAPFAIGSHVGLATALESLPPDGVPAAHFTHWTMGLSLHVAGKRRAPRSNGYRRRTGRSRADRCHGRLPKAAVAPPYRPDGFS